MNKPHMFCPRMGSWASTPCQQATLEAAVWEEDALMEAQEAQEAQE